MKPGINNYSEIGKLNKVLLHRIGDEIEGLVPDNFERLLFDDIPYLKVAQQEHDKFADVLRENDVEVIYYVDETVKALRDRKVRERFVKEFVSESDIHSDAVKEALEEYLMSMSVKDMVEKTISGVKKSELSVKSTSLADYISSGYPYYTDPMPNLYFTRDQGACVGDGVISGCIVNLSKSTMVKTVSRCMKALHFGMSNTSIFLNDDLFSIFRANCSMPATVVLCESPIATISSDSTSTSPPSIEYAWS